MFSIREHLVHTWTKYELILSGQHILQEGRLSVFTVDLDQNLKTSSCSRIHPKLPSVLYAGNHLWFSPKVSDSYFGVQGCVDNIYETKFSMRTAVKFVVVEEVWCVKAQGFIKDQICSKFS